jgi:hypothetical protein
MYCKLAASTSCASSFASKNQRRKPLGSRRKKRRIQGREKCIKGFVTSNSGNRSHQWERTWVYRR